MNYINRARSACEVVVDVTGCAWCRSESDHVARVGCVGGGVLFRTCALHSKKKKR